MKKSVLAFTLFALILLSSLLSVSFATSLNATAPSPSAALPFPIDYDLGGPEGLYTSTLAHWAREALKGHWPPTDFDFRAPSIHPENPVQVLALETAQRPLLAGIAQQTVIQASFQQVESVLDQIDGYAQIFPDYKVIQVLSRDRNTSISFWEQIIPIFFVPNIRFKMAYVSVQPRPHLKLYRYKLKESKDLKTSDGLIGIESIEKSSSPQVRYTEIDFFDLDVGMASSLPHERLWRETLEGIYLSDLGIKLKSENPSWAGEKVREESKKILKRFPVEPALKNKKTAPSPKR